MNGRVASASPARPGGMGRSSAARYNIRSKRAGASGLACHSTVRWSVPGDPVFLDFGLVFNAILLVAGLWWCKEVFERWRDDVAELKESDDNVRKCVVLFFWLFTLTIIVLIVNFVWGIVENIINAFR